MRPVRLLALASLVFTLSCGDDKDSGDSTAASMDSGGSDTSAGSSGLTATDSSPTSGGDQSGSATADDGADTGSPCGNGMLDMGENCDGTNLDGATCESLGEGSGTLACDPVTCMYDTSMCVGDTTGGTTG